MVIKYGFTDYSVIDMYWFISCLDSTILKFNLTHIKFKIIDVHITNITTCLEYEKYKKMYKLLYNGV